MFMILPVLEPNMGTCMQKVGKEAKRVRAGERKGVSSDDV
jgi:hypothetical protein